MSYNLKPTQIPTIPPIVLPINPQKESIPAPKNEGIYPPTTEPTKVAIVTHAF